MPEEINRVITDQPSDLLLTPSLDANQNLLREGVAEERIKLVGNVMIDTLVCLLPMARAKLAADLPARYALVTMHRPANVDDPEFLRDFLRTLDEISQELPIIFPVPPRTKQRATDFGFNLSRESRMQLSDPVSYLEFLALQAGATLVITDSGGVQEETTYLGVPCLTVRENTERPVTTMLGTNVLVGRSMERLHIEVDRVLRGPRKPRTVPPLWDGHTAEWVAEA
jgi:UDP-N-acetylglucosamine 2-epimerase (non-hydrolysing)